MVDGLFLMEQFLGKWSEGHGYEIKGTWKLQQLEYVLCRDLMVVPYSAGDKIPLDRCGLWSNDL